MCDLIDARLERARITLCVLAGLFGAWKFVCGGHWTLTVLNPGRADLSAIEEALPYLYGAIVIDFVLLGIAIAMVALLLTGQANRYFNPPKMMATPAY